MQCGLLGRKLGHSYSPQIHKELADYEYILKELEPEKLGDFLQKNEFQGLNVTIPYKKDVIPYCCELSPCAKKVGAVNTIIRRKDGTLIGHNTDYFGFSSMVKRSGLQVSGKKVLVLGSGGSSVTATVVLQELGADVVVISRTGDNNYTNLHRHADASVIVNTTPVGMFPNVGISPVNLDIFPALEGVLDIIYNPARTQLLLDAEEKGLVTENGLWMLVAQAKESAEWFTGCQIDDDLIPRIHHKLRQQMENIVLIGMPGSGKSTIGELLANAISKEFVDADKCIVEKAGISIPEIFQRFGEAYFRDLETEVLSDLGKRSGLVIATGGGCVTKNRNYTHLHQNSIIIWLQRELCALATDGRPLSQSGKLEEMYRFRHPLYQAFADVIVQNSSNPDDVVANIISQLQMEVK